MDTRRHDGIFDYRFFSRPIHVIGVGGVGSHVVRHLVKLGCGQVSPLVLWDGDEVSAHNIANQAYDLDDVGRFKVNACTRHARRYGSSCEKLVPIREHFEGQANLEGIVFVCVDSMATRKMIWERSIKANRAVVGFIETRMDATMVIVNTILPANESHAQRWEYEWHPDNEATNDTAACGGHLSVGPTASMAADVAVWQFIHLANHLQGKGALPPQQVRAHLRNMQFSSHHW